MAPLNVEEKEGQLIVRMSRLNYLPENAMYVAVGVGMLVIMFGAGVNWLALISLPLALVLLFVGSTRLWFDVIQGQTVVMDRLSDSITVNRVQQARVSEVKYVMVEEDVLSQRSRRRPYQGNWTIRLVARNQAVAIRSDDFFKAQSVAAVIAEYLRVPCKKQETAVLPPPIRSTLP